MIVVLKDSRLKWTIQFVYKMFTKEQYFKRSPRPPIIARNLTQHLLLNLARQVLDIAIAIEEKKRISFDVIA